MTRRRRWFMNWLFLFLLNLVEPSALHFTWCNLVWIKDGSRWISSQVVNNSLQTLYLVEIFPDAFFFTKLMKNCIVANSIALFLEFYTWNFGACAENLYFYLQTHFIVYNTDWKNLEKTLVTKLWLGICLQRRLGDILSLYCEIVNKTYRKLPQFYRCHHFRSKMHLANAENINASISSQTA